MIAGFVNGLFAAMLGELLFYFLFRRTLPPFPGGLKGTAILAAFVATVITLVTSHGPFWALGNFIGLMAGYHLAQLAVNGSLTESNDDTEEPGILTSLIRRIKLERMAMDYVYACGNSWWNKETRRQARELIKDDHHNPL